MYDEGEGADTDDSVAEIDGVRLIIELGELNEIGGDDCGVVVGRMNDVSKDVSRPSWMAMLGAVSDARRTEES